MLQKVCAQSYIPGEVITGVVWTKKLFSRNWFEASGNRLPIGKVNASVWLEVCTPCSFICRVA